MSALPESPVELTVTKTAPSRWSREEEERLLAAFSQGASMADLAEAHGRSAGALESRLHKLDALHYGPYTNLATESRLPDQEEAPANNGQPWTEADSDLLRQQHADNPTPAALLALAETLQRSPRSLVLKLVQLEIIETTRNPNPQPTTWAPTEAAMAAKKKATTSKNIGQKITATGNGKKLKVTITPEFQDVQQLLEHGHNVLVQGSAGTGKSTFLKWLRHKWAKDKNHVVLAPTGMAALQVGGQTLHSFFGFKPQLLLSADDWRKPRNPKLYEKLELIIIDEISMVRADVMDAIDLFLQKYGPQKRVPFGGVQILALGDLFQLPPVVRRDELGTFNERYETPFFFSSYAWRGNPFVMVEFTHIFRQSDADFIDLLNRVRHGERSGALLDALNQRHSAEVPSGAVILAARNSTVDDINQRELARLTEAEYTYNAKTSGKVDAGSFTSPAELVLKPGARVMFTRNDAQGRWVNGTLGVVLKCRAKEVTVRTTDGEEWLVEPMKWELTKYELDPNTEQPVATVAGTYSQLPLALAWALTIHKAQGQTLEQCVVDLRDGGAFAEGQLYVALSRARALESLYLAQPISASDIRTAQAVKNFYAALPR